LKAFKQGAHNEAVFEKVLVWLLGRHACEKRISMAPQKMPFSFGLSMPAVCVAALLQINGGYKGLFFGFVLGPVSVVKH
jgi:hypothetical protein